MYLQPKLNMKVSQRQVLTPGLVQMVSVLALNKLELKDMINSEMVENPVLEELEEAHASLDERTGLEGDRERSVEAVAEEAQRVEKDPFDEIDFGSYFQDYLDPGFKTASNFEDYDKPSFEHFLSQPSTLTDHLLWQLGSLNLTREVRAAAELIVGNLDGNGYLTAEDDELAQALVATMRAGEPIPFERGLPGAVVEIAAGQGEMLAVVGAREIVQQLDPLGVGARGLRECLLIQICAQEREAGVAGAWSVFGVARHIVGNCLQLLQKKDMRELTKSCGRDAEDVKAAVEYIRTLDPRPGATVQRERDAVDRAGCGVCETGRQLGGADE